MHLVRTVALLRARVCWNPQRQSPDDQDPPGPWLTSGRPRAWSCSQKRCLLLLLLDLCFLRQRHRGVRGTSMTFPRGRLPCWQHPASSHRPPLKPYGVTSKLYPNSAYTCPPASPGDLSGCGSDRGRDLDREGRPSAPINSRGGPRAAHPTRAISMYSCNTPAVRQALLRVLPYIADKRM